MATGIGPSHFVFFSALQRRKFWLEHLSAAFNAAGSRQWPLKKTELDRKHQKQLGRLPDAPPLGIIQPLPLQNALDDTPVDAFLHSIADDLGAYENELLTLMNDEAVDPAWQQLLENVSVQWGRELAQECLLSPSSKLSSRSLRGLFELCHRVLEGGEFSWKPLLKRRYSDDELQYELRRCPHAGGGPAADLACRLESFIYRGFTQTLVPDARYARTRKTGYCLDELRLDK